VRIEMEATHGPGGCTWLVRHDGCATTFTSRGVPGFARWLQAVGSCCPETASARAGGDVTCLAAAFWRIIGDIRGKARCDLCWPDVSSRRQMAAAAKLNRNADDEPGPGRPRQLRAAEAARLAAIAADPDGQRARAVVSTGEAARERRESGVITRAAAEIAEARARQDAAARAAPARAVTYADARTVYMASGTIADKEAMLAFVTMTEPDLEKLGSEWEPSPPAIPSRPPVITRRRAGLALLADALLLSVTHALMPAWPLIGLLSMACLLLGVLVYRPLGRQ
jgi:hypothetical protein